MNDELLIKVTEHHGRLNNLEKTMFGNGTPGIQKDLRDIRDEVTGFKGFVNGSKWVLGFIGITQLINLIIGAENFFTK